MTALDDTLAMTGADDLDNPMACLDCGSEQCAGWPLCGAPDDPQPAGEDTPVIRHHDDIDPPALPATDDEWATFTIADHEHLTRMLRALRSIRRRQDAHRALIEPELDRLHAEIARLEAWATDRNAPLAESAARIERAAEQYAIASRTDRRKSFATPYGTVQTREAGGGWEVVNSAEVLAWAKDNAPDLVKSTESFVKADANRAFTVAPTGDVVVKATGQVVPGVSVVPKRVTASVSLEPTP